VGRVFHAHNHTVIYHRQVLEQGVTDPIVCAAAIANDAILVAVDADMKRLAKRYGAMPTAGRFESLNLIWIGCNGPLASKRAEQAMSLIEHEWAFSVGKAARRLWIEIGPHHIRTYR
jgi:hypothetical protein